ncbi:hypothetical protein EMPS_07814 [Entomortierella parvispora]|uniref:Uncharacterized protein n=1 Tax=Entomortierella parvispora TaxID=205924 RepID=A0A9P3HEU5_9FUNG|nr:hypothetical protein EMPS_07814 [Entomortierella parvispora]
MLRMTLAHNRMLITLTWTCPRRSITSSLHGSNAVKLFAPGSPIASFLDTFFRGEHITENPTPGLLAAWRQICGKPSKKAQFAALGSS